MAGFTIEGVAELAGASKMTIYKWWPSKGVLALEAYAAGVDEVLTVPDTGGRHGGPDSRTWQPSRGS